MFLKYVLRSSAVLSRVACGLVALAAALAGCGGSERIGSGQRVIAAFYPLAFAAERIAPGADVTNLTPAGAEPHDLELSARDVEAIGEADLVLYLGAGFMPALEDATRGRENGLDLLEGLDLREGADAHGHEGEEEEKAAGEEEEADLDPHVWLDPMRYAALVRELEDALGEPGAADVLVAELEALDTELREGLERCERRQIVTSHAAFGYLADAYELEQIPLTGLSPEVEPSARAIEELVDEVREGRATTVFFETLVSPKLAETVAREAGVRTAVLNPLEGLTAEEIERGEDYFSVMRDNLAVLREALGCT
ncbi:MAG TPA: metal ABC transporter substrate-binding protein [Gaiellaceae bacterium]|nr:metal ABC transporter substrate-binding protein [Gaiellaceae bacterium]